MTPNAANPPHSMKTNTGGESPTKQAAYADWLGAVYIEIENALGCTRSDAQGIADAQPFALAQSWGAGKDALETAEAVLKAGKRPAAGQAAHTPMP